MGERAGALSCDMLCIFFCRFISLNPNPLPVVVVVLLDLEGSLPTLIYSLTKCNACVAS